MGDGAMDDAGLTGELELVADEGEVSSAAGYELVVSTLLNDSSAVHEEDSVGVADGAEAVGGHDEGLAALQLEDAVGDTPLVGGIERGGGFVEE